jgi:hypothetical protein
VTAVAPPLEATAAAQVETAQEDDMMSTRNKLLTLGIVAIVALALCAPVLARHAPAPKKSFTVIGKVQSVDEGANSLVVHVRLGSVAVKRFIGRDLTIAVAPKAKVLTRVGRWLKAIGLADLSPGDRVTVVGTIDRADPKAPVYVAHRIVEHTLVPWMKLRHFGARGHIVSVDATKGSLAIHLNAVTRALQTSLGSDFTFKVGPHARIFTLKNGVKTAITLADVAVGDWAKAFGSVNRKDPNAPVFTIHWLMVIHPTPAT